MIAQIGLSDPTGGIVVLLAAAVAGALGLTLIAMGAIRLARPRRSRRAGWVMSGIGLVLACPALWLAFMLFGAR